MSELLIAFEPDTRAAARERAARPKLQPARVARTLALAHALQRRVDCGEFEDYADMARAFGFSRTRITQMMNLTVLAPDIQEEILFLEFPPGEQPLTEEAIHLNVLPEMNWAEQRRRWAALRKVSAPSA